MLLCVSMFPFIQGFGQKEGMSRIYFSFYFVYFGQDMFMFIMNNCTIYLHAFLTITLLSKYEKYGTSVTVARFSPTVQSTDEICFKYFQ